MKVFIAAYLLFASVGITQANVISDPNITLSEQQQEDVSDFFAILLAVYDNDISLIPDEPNEILALETSEDSRDQLAWEIFKMLRREFDPNSLSSDPNSTSIDEQNTSVTALIENADPNTNSLPVVSNSETAANTAEIEPSQQEAESLQQKQQQIESMQSMEQVEELANPLGSRILQSKTYRITTLPLEIEGHVVIPAGTKLIAPFDPNHSVIEVMPGGLLDMGKAAYYSDPNCPNILPPVEIVPEDPNIYFGHNFVGIWVRRGAAPATCINNVIVNNCKIGIIIDEQLANPVRNVITFGCYDGIHLYAPAQIIDSEFWYNGSVYDEIYDYAGAGIYILLDSVQYPYPAVSIDRTIFCDGDVGIYIEGHNPDPNFADPNQVVPSLEVINSCFVWSYFFGVYKTEGDVSIDLEYCAFGGNEYDVNFDAPFTGCIGLEYNPFYILGEGGKIYIDQQSELIDAGYGMAEDGTGTCDYQPDIGQQDIGCHFPIGVSGGFGIPSSPADFNWDGIVDELDLELMNLCMGAIADPNIVKIDTNYDSRVNLPDFGLFAVDYGYSDDPNLPGSHDPNCERSDFNGDHRVDLADLEILAQNWLTLVFDEYRICGLCNIGTNTDPNEPSTSNIIDSKDYDALMADWGKVSYAGCSVSFRNEQDMSLEPNSLSNEIAICPDNYPPFTNWMFAQVDGCPAGLTYLDYSEPPTFTAPTHEFSNGNHIITVGGYTSEGGCWMEKIQVQFHNCLYFASIPTMYEPNEPYEIRGFFDGGSMQISTDPNSYVISDSGYIQYSSIITGENPAATIQYQNGSDSQTKTVALMAKVDMSKIDPNSYRALIVAPCKDVNKAMEDKDLPNNRVLTAIRETLEMANIPYAELIEKNAHWDNIKTALTGSNLNYVYWIGHMNSHVGRVINEETGEIVAPGVQRTEFMCWDKRKYWFDKESCVLSWVKSDRPDVPPSIPMPDLPGDWDTRGHSMASLGLWKTKTIKEFWAIGCKSAVKWETENWNDMAMAVGVYNYKDSSGHYTHIYIGNRIDVMPGGAKNLLIGYPSAISKIIRRHRTTHLGDALLTNDLTSNELWALWGDDRDRDGMADNTLQWWPADIELWRVVFQ